MMLAASRIASPLGMLTLVAEDAGLVAVLWPNEDARRVPLSPTEARAHPVLEKATRQLGDWFAGRRRDFDLPLAPRGTPFQLAVWDALAAIPFGNTRSYAAIAREIGKPDAVRAVGAANGRNPLSIVLPCHRVVGSAGALTGFAGGLAAKRWLLAHEAADMPLFTSDGAI
ncbi:methylated-DNA--[protein]-cysteine S-methyltransferase [Sphingomonas sp.]|uniref:methylated-DNA--[protein]-cysteine S-methyltransferase n=1 Tax=Sphingomonas sp. TaxID=28214 RepID=UPI003B00C9A4